jgi:uncharacterized DUF497 family protein
MEVRFSWDVFKKASNVDKHGVTFEEAIETLCDPLVLTVLDHRHPADERRYIGVGETKAGKLLTVGFADDGDVIRIITARRATKKERRSYED